ncbi:hypothetical protein OIU74_011034 [Salix koriyanagi]|uniref:EF-hand domain-containing protein n=1 Tax=Salix koriyanagi TaxID=2511006 RepID=A0A9Q0TE93_9ROSI|nr:hypothetical protein OIU74_011034 [Salix koriyanagi]
MYVVWAHNIYVLLKWKRNTFFKLVQGFPLPGMTAIIDIMFLYGSAHVMKRPLFSQACELAFTECDTGGHGLISEQELGDAIRLAIPNLDDDEIHELFNIFDTDGDGIVSKNNFTSRLRQNPLLIALFAPCLVHKYSSQVGHRILEIV